MLIVKIIQFALVFLVVGIGVALYSIPALHFAAALDRPGLVNVLLWVGYDIEARANSFKDSVAMTPIEWAARSDAANATMVLVKAGARPVGGRGALHVAVKHARLDVIKILLNSGVNPNLPSATGGSTTLHWLIGSTGYRCSDRKAERIEITKTLLLHGANPNAPSPLTTYQIKKKIQESGSTPLYDAIQRGCVDLVRLLMEYGANKHAVVYGESILEAFKGGKIPARWMGSGSDLAGSRDGITIILNE